MIAPVVRVGQRDGDELALAPFRGADENAARVPGIAGLDADTAVIAPKQLVVIGKRPARADRSFGRDDRAELCVLQRCLRKVGQIERSGIIFAAVQPVRVGKVRLRQAQRTGAQIHLADKRCFAAGNGDCQRQGGIIAGMEHHAVEQIAARQRLILFHTKT